MQLIGSRREAQASSQTKLQKKFFFSVSRRASSCCSPFSRKRVGESVFVTLSSVERERRRVSGLLLSLRALEVLETDLRTPLRVRKLAEKRVGESGFLLSLECWNSAPKPSSWRRKSWMKHVTWAFSWVSAFLSRLTFVENKNEEQNGDRSHTLL